ncbi:MAG: glucose 1-dehydrogenase [Candidatus Kaistia colombiensis]|nr:MAG: glucose 1-dehydrogenase [Kaistia sp.]
MRSDLTGKVAFVTGAAGGIGRGIVSRLAANGASIVVADINEEGAREVAASLPDALAVSVDIRDPESIDRAVAATVAAYGRLDILVNNAGVNTHAHRVDVDAFPIEEWHRIVGIDLDGLFFMTRRALEPMLAAGRGGRVVNIASVVGLAAMRLQSPFVAAKAGIIHLTRSMALELGPKGVVVNAIAPGSIMTEGTKSLFYGANGQFQAKTQAFMQHIPLGRPGTPEEIGEAVLFLSARESGYINGQILAVDGGWTAGYMM